ncbi:hypothetical protein IQ220_11010 [Cyanobium sp. LEGE 06113]|nr:hypothetical protein [Cyanobium sp. LEGE 06113]
MTREATQAGVNLPHDTQARLLELGGSNFSVGVRAKAEQYLGVAEPPARLSSSGGVWLEKQSCELLAAAIGADVRVICWPARLLILARKGNACPGSPQGK